MTQTYVLRDDISHGSLDETRANAVDSNAKLAKLLSCSLGKSYDSGLGRRIIGLAYVARLA